MPHISDEDEKLLRRLTIAELRHLLTTVMDWGEVQRILGLCAMVQKYNTEEPCALCQSMVEKLEME